MFIQSAKQKNHRNENHPTKPNKKQNYQQKHPRNQYLHLKSNRGPKFNLPRSTTKFHIDQLGKELIIMDTY